QSTFLIRTCPPLATVLRNSPHDIAFVPGILGIARSDSSCMDSSKPGLDLERELTCSICTELLYQPLTLLDCLHTYCGACLKDWFSFQANQAENAPNPPAAGTNIFTCPSCRAPVRDTRHNATVATLLDMLVAANPDRRRSRTDVEEMSKKYKPGDQVLPELRLLERTQEERRADEEERRMLQDVRALSLREAGVESSLAPRHRRRREDSSSADGRTQRSRDHSRDSRHSNRYDGSRRPRADEGRSSADQLQPDARSSEHRRRRRSESRHRSEESTDTRRRQIEHQSSLRSLISSGDLTLVSANFAPSPPTEPLSPRMQRSHRPADLSIISQATSGPVGLGLGIGSPTTPGHQRTRSQLYPEPSITCARCAKQHIEYELHYNCSICASGNWNICLDCYRSGKGCLHWFGFGYGAWAKWEKARHAAQEDIPRPHMLTANRYLQPKIIPGGAEGRRTLTTDDPIKRLESGNFCARCLTWANECFWRCDICNFGDWGFCNNCVNQGRSCTHPLLPLTYQPQLSHTPPASPRSPRPPQSAAVLTGPNIHSIGPFKPLTFTTRCDVCQDPISPSHSRYHCFTCTSSIEPDTQPGDYDICTNCYANLEARDQISPENGHVGWRRCLNGHRMIVVGFRDGPGGQLRHILSDLVGGRNLRITPAEGSDEQAPQKWWWYEGGQKRERFVTRDVAADAPTSDGLAQGFPPDGGSGMRASATWAWYPKAEDELLFPKGAEIREIEDVNGDWFFGVYMGAKGLFPSPYVRRLDDHA
ncbi:RING finger domain-containing protein, partial [Colletotrichum incanum]